MTTKHRLTPVLVVSGPRHSRRQTGRQVEDVRTEDVAANQLSSPTQSIEFDRSLAKIKNSSIAAILCSDDVLDDDLPITITIQHVRIRLKSRFGK